MKFQQRTSAAMTKLIICVLLLASGLCFRPGMSTTVAIDETTVANDATTVANDATTLATEASTAKTSEQASTKAAGTTVNPTGTTFRTTGETNTGTVEQTTMTMEITTDNVTTDNATNESTTMETTTPLVTTLPTPGTYAVNGSDGICILMQLFLEVSIKYTTTDGKGNTTTVVFPDNSIPTGNCTDTSRYFSLALPEYDDWYLRLDFNVDEKMYEMSSVAFQWKYEEPFFTDAKKMGETNEIELNDPKTLNVRAETGKTFACKERELGTDLVGIILKEIKYQPYADLSAKKGEFGDEEVCAEDKPTSKPQNPTDTGMIVGIVLGCLAGVVLILGGVYLFMRNRSNRESYKSLD